MKKLLQIIGGNLFSGVKDLIDETFTSKEEKAEASRKLNSLFTEAQLKIQSEVTERLKIDMSSDSWLSKNIRPMTLIFILLVYSFFSVCDGNFGDFNINNSYVALLGKWGEAIMYFYFGGRTLEKAINIIKNKNK